MGPADRPLIEKPHVSRLGGRVGVQNVPLLSVGVSSVMAESRPPPYRRALPLCQQHGHRSDSRREMARDRGSCVSSGSRVPAMRERERMRPPPASSSPRGVPSLQLGRASESGGGGLRLDRESRRATSRHPGPLPGVSCRPVGHSHANPCVSREPPQVPPREHGPSRDSRSPGPRH